jgi:hypothetical protein
MLIIKKDCSFSRTNKPIEAEDDEEKEDGPQS